MLNFLNTSITYEQFINISYIGLLIYFIGLIGFIFNQKNLIVTMMSAEVMYLGLIFLFITTSLLLNDPKGQIYGLIILILAAAESALGLGLLIVLHRFSDSINFAYFQQLRG